MRIGTPLSSHPTRIMLLGAGELGKEVIIALQRLGVEVIAVDRYANAPGHQVAHRAHVIDMTDVQALRTLVEKEKPHLIVPEIEAIATDELARIEADGVAEVIPTARATQLTMNREGIRRLAAETLGLPTSHYAFADSLEELQEDRFLLGPADRIAEQIIGYNRRLGINAMVLSFHWVGMPQTLVLEQMQMFAEAVMPKVEQAL